MVEVVKSRFFNFVITLSEQTAKKIIWDKYFEIKAESGRIPAMKKGTAEFAAVCLLREYAGILPHKELAGYCEYFFYEMFQYTPSDVIRTYVNNALKKLDCGISLVEYAGTVEYLKQFYGKWLSETEFSRGREDFDYKEAYEKYKNVTAAMLDGWEDMQKNADTAGLSVHMLQPDMTLNKETEKFFEQQEQDAKENYEDYQSFDETSLYEAYQKLEVIPFQTAYVSRLAASMEKRLDEIKRQEWKQVLNSFKQAVSDKLLSGRIVYGDDEFRVKQAEDSFINSGKFEYVMLINDTSKRMNTKEGVAVTTKNLYYKGLLGSGEIPVEDISHFEFSGSMFSQGLTVWTNNGKKYSVPCEVGKTEHYKYLTMLEALIRLLKSTVVSQSGEAAPKQEEAEEREEE